MSNINPIDNTTYQVLILYPRKGRKLQMQNMRTDAKFSEKH